jgi:hypothetical protein
MKVLPLALSVKRETRLWPTTRPVSPDGPACRGE